LDFLKANVEISILNLCIQKFNNYFN